MEMLTNGSKPADPEVVERAVRRWGTVELRGERAAVVRTPVRKHLDSTGGR